MRLRQHRWLRRTTVVVLLGVTLLPTLLPQPALAADLLIPQDGSDGDVPFVQQPAPPATSPSAVQLIPTTPFVEDPTRQAGGEDDAQRANERTVDQRNDDDGHRRK